MGDINRQRPIYRGSVYNKKGLTHRNKFDLPDLKKSIAMTTLFFMLFQMFSPLGFLTVDKAYAAISLVNPYKNYQNWYKGNLHAHSSYGPSDNNADNNDDGKETRTEVGNWYNDNGFDFYALTPHYRPFSYTNGSWLGPEVTRATLTPNPDVNGIVWMGYSMEDHLNTVGNRSECSHTNLINLSSNLYSSQTLFGKTEQVGNRSILTDLNAQNTINAVNDGGGITILNHPYYFDGCSTTAAVDAAKQLDNLTGVEIKNGSKNATNPNGLSSNTVNQKSTWDEMLLAGKKVWGFANDDGHKKVNQSATTNEYYLNRGTGFNVVNSNIAASKDDIVANVKAGNFYSSSPYSVGNVNKTTGASYVAPSGFYDLKVETSGETITTSTTNGTSIRRVVGFKNGTITETTITGKTMVYPAMGTEKYVRFEILNSSGGEVAWSQPVYVASIPVASYVSPTNGSIFNTTTIGGTSKIVGGLVANATSPVSEKISLKVEYKKTKDKNGAPVTDRWHNFGCHESSSPDGDGDSANSSLPLYSCATASANGVSNTGWTDRNKDGVLDYITSGSSQVFPGGSTDLSLAAGTYTWVVQATTESVPLTGAYSVWTSGRTFVVLDPDTIAPTISAGPTTSSISQTSAVISWTTNELSDTQVDYGLTTDYGSSTALNTTKTTDHISSLSGLTTGTNYHYRLKSKDTAGNLRTSGDYAFNTLELVDSTPPVISEILITGLGQTSATINWKTNEASDSQVEYGTSVSYGASSALNNSKATLHKVILSGLNASTDYNFRVKSKDYAGNLQTSENVTFSTTSIIDSTAPTVTVTSPLSGEEIGGTVSIQATADDNINLAKVEFYIDSTKIGESTVEPYMVDFDTTSYDNDFYKLTAKAYDVTGNNTTSDAVQIFLANRGQVVAVTSLAIAPSVLLGTLAELNGAQIPYSIEPVEATNKTVLWGSSNENIASVDQGSLTFSSAGTVTITGTTEDGNFSDALTITASQNPEKYDISENNNMYVNNGVAIFFEELPTNVADGFNMDVSTPSSFLSKTGDKTIILSKDITPSKDLTEGFSALINLYYPEGQVAKMTDSAMYWNGNTWTSQGIETVSINQSNNGVYYITFKTTHFSQFGIATNTVNSGSPVVVPTNTANSTNSTLGGQTLVLPVTGYNLKGILINYVLAMISFCIFTLLISSSRFRKIIYKD